MSVIAAEDVHVVLVDHCGMRVTGARPSLGIQRLHQVPRTVLDAVPVEVVDSVVAIVSTKDVDAAIMDNRGVPVPRRWRLGIAEWGKLAPRIRLEIEAIEVITPVCTVVPTENVEVVLEGDGGVQ